jgi:hypothetical protein
VILHELQHRLIDRLELFAGVSNDRAGTGQHHVDEGLVGQLRTVLQRRAHCDDVDQAVNRIRRRVGRGGVASRDAAAAGQDLPVDTGPTLARSADERGREHDHLPDFDRMADRHQRER